jgi:hypothetical protein
MSPSCASCTTRRRGSRPATDTRRAFCVTVRIVRSWLPVLLLVACSNEGGTPSEQAKPTEVKKRAGVLPDHFKCDSIIPNDQLSQVLGGTIRQIDNSMPVPRGVPQPCNYEVTTTNGAEAWTYDIDCRDGMKKRADALFAQYAADSAANVAAYAAIDAGPKPAKPDPDAGPPPRAPEGAVEVAVGAKGLDHHGQGLLFIDDDAPCYVRVVGNDPTKRLELAKLIAKNLTFANAPMTPRPFPGT